FLQTARENVAASAHVSIVPGHWRNRLHPRFTHWSVLHPRWAHFFPRVGKCQRRERRSRAWCDPGPGRIVCLGADALRAVPPLGEESEEDDMRLDDTAAGLCWRSTGILVMEDGLICGRGIAGHAERGNFGVATPAPSFASVLVCALAGIAATGALLI